MLMLTPARKQRMRVGKLRPSLTWPGRRLMWRELRASNLPSEALRECTLQCQERARCLKLWYERALMHPHTTPVAIP